MAASRAAQFVLHKVSSSRYHLLDDLFLLPMTLAETNDAFTLRLQAFFAEEARGHLAQVDASLAGLMQARAGQPGALVIPVRRAGKRDRGGGWRRIREEAA